LIYGGGEDACGTAGILTHIMNTAELAEGMVQLARSKELREQMGECGYRRVVSRYQLTQMQETYARIYDEVYDMMYEQKYEKTVDWDK
ncbi:MAG: hypothetical protein K2O57_03965, partial [Acetatifactor sp.]|nr:hypothetical protein [Acetatifactor sp.]